MCVMSFDRVKNTSREVTWSDIKIFPSNPGLILVCYSVGMWIVDHEVGGPSLCLAVLHLATAEDRFSWGGAATEGQCALLAQV